MVFIGAGTIVGIAGLTLALVFGWKKLKIQKPETAVKVANLCVTVRNKLTGILIKAGFGMILGVNFVSFEALPTPKAKTGHFIVGVLILLVSILATVKLALFFKSRVNSEQTNEGGHDEKDLDSTEVKDYIGNLYQKLNPNSHSALNY